MRTESVSRTQGILCVWVLAGYPVIRGNIARTDGTGKFTGAFRSDYNILPIESDTARLLTSRGLLQSAPRRHCADGRSHELSSVGMHHNLSLCWGLRWVFGMRCAG